MTIRVDTSGLEELRRRLQRLTTEQTEDVLGELGEELLANARYRIRIAEASPEGTPYPALSPRWARRTADPSDFLQDAGALLRSFTELVEGESVVAGSPLVRAAAHQFGSRARRIPARPFLGIGEDDADELELIAARFLERALMGEATSNA